ncbi:hypothetical protein Tco_1384010 [Tanacetum coccineum]
MQDKKPYLSFFHVFVSLCYPTNDNDDLGKLDAKADIGIFVGYAPAKKAFGIYNKRTRKFIETIHVTFDELTAMASKQFSSRPGLHSMIPAISSSGLVLNPVSQQPCIPPKRDDYDRLFQPMFDEYLNPLSDAVSPVQEAAAPRAVVLTDSLVQRIENKAKTVIFSGSHEAALTDYSTVHTRKLFIYKVTEVPDSEEGFRNDWESSTSEGLPRHLEATWAA